MNHLLSKIAIFALLGTPTLFLAACKTGAPAMGGTETDKVMAVDDGIMEVDTLTMSATVVAIDSKSRKVTLKSDDTGEEETFKAPKSVDLSGLSVGDNVQAEVTEAVAVFIGDDLPPSVSEDGGLAVSADGKSGVIAETSQVTAVVKAVDSKNRKVTFELPDGTTKKVSAGKDLDLSGISVGESLTVVLGESLALSISGN